MMNGTRLAALWITVSAAVDILFFILTLGRHLSDPMWPPHAHFHVVLCVIWLAGLTVMLLALVWGPLQEGKRWSFWASLTGFLVAQAGYFVAILFVWDGRPTTVVNNVALGIDLLIGAIGFFLMRQAVWRQAVPQQKPG